MDNNKTKLIKICFVSPKAYPLFNPAVKKVFGGAEIDLYILARELAKDRDYEVSFVVADYGQNDTEIIEGVKILKSLDFKQNPLTGAIKIWKAMRQANSQIYFQETISSGTFLVALFCRICKRKFVYRTANQGEADGSHIKLQRFNGKAIVWSLRHATQIIVQNETDKAAIKKTTGVSSMVIPNAHHLSLLSEDKNKDIILWAGRSTKIKRPELFIKLAKAVPQEHFVQICQEATDDKTYQELLAQAEKVQNLEFIKRVDFHDIDQFFRRAKVFVNTSDSEGFPNTFVQACKNSTPILSLSVNPDNFLDKNKCGLCAEGNWQKFIDDLNFLLKPETVKEYGQNGLEYAKKNHDIKIIISEYKKLFKSLTTFPLHN